MEARRVIVVEPSPEMSPVEQTAFFRRILIACLESIKFDRNARLRYDDDGGAPLPVVDDSREYTISRMLHNMTQPEFLAMWQNKYLDPIGKPPKELR